jgi:hypothetical protein
VDRQMKLGFVSDGQQVEDKDCDRDGEHPVAE